MSEGGFRGLLYEPTYEDEVLILFSMLIPSLRDEYVINRYSGAFPDCFATRNGQEVGIEFELLSSHFFDHGHNESDRLEKCDMLVCWRNNLHTGIIKENGKYFLVVQGHRIEVVELRDVVRELQEASGRRLILKGTRPNESGANEERFFEQLRENVGQERYALVHELYDRVRKTNDFEIRWGQGKRFSTMRVFVRKWKVDPISIGSDGIATIVYQGNPSIEYWCLPESAEIQLRQLFGHKQQKWPSIPLNNRDDYQRMNEALDILASHADKAEPSWHTPGQ